MEIKMDGFPRVIGDRSREAERWHFCFSIDGVPGYQLEMFIHYQNETAVIDPVCHKDGLTSVACPLCGLDRNVSATVREEPIVHTYCLWVLEDETRWREIGAACIQKTGLFFVTNRNIYLGYYNVTYNVKALVFNAKKHL